MDESAKSKREDDDVMSVAQDFFVTSARRFPITRNGRLIGQVSRRDLLKSVRRLFPEPTTDQQPLYFSSTASDVTAVTG